MTKRTWIAGLAVLGLVACVRTKGNDADAGAPAPTAAATTGHAGAAPAESSGPDEEVHPVYAADAPPDPLAQRLCDALQETPSKRRAACCNAPRPAPSPVAECVRNLSAALHLGTVSLAAKDVDACVAATNAQLEGCDWLAAHNPQVPAACTGIFHGSLAKGQRCRSSLECGQGLQCAGVGPTDPGVCAPPGGAGAGCSRSVDPLATFTRQDDLEADHPACDGVCKMGKCQAPVAAGGACIVNPECAKGTLCQGGKCTPGKPGKIGEACPANACEANALCKAGTCVALARDGEACASHWECRSGTCTGGKCASACRP